MEKMAVFSFLNPPEDSFEKILSVVVEVMDTVFRTSENGFWATFLASFDRKYMQQIEV